MLGVTRQVSVARNILGIRGIASVSLPGLGYDYGALEPHISGEIMKLHYDKHHATYVANYNKALEQYAQAEAKSDTAAMIALHSALKFNGGGHVLLVESCWKLSIMSLVTWISSSLSLIQLLQLFRVLDGDGLDTIKLPVVFKSKHVLIKIHYQLPV
eukprot:TRINITY_DN10841_c0_g1_i1.p1 TRINITY_DN10841_c0_g1~~TRINITY_DN10841_c0_g1_i1.p1  ORF type:complete len:157 (+),score=11.42 TRINITY_DN10841_c0_g1_i1:3-473(+)